VYLSVTDREGNPISNLEKENFTIYEFEEQKEIQQFERGVNVQRGINLLRRVKPAFPHFQCRKEQGYMPKTV